MVFSLGERGRKAQGKGRKARGKGEEAQGRGGGYSIIFGAYIYIIF